MCVSVCVCVCVRVRACLRACERACFRVCVCVSGFWIFSTFSPWVKFSSKLLCVSE